MTTSIYIIYEEQFVKGVFSLYKLGFISYNFKSVKQLFDLYILLVVIHLIVFASGTYSESFENGSMEIIRTTKVYKKNMLIRILPVILYGIFLTLIATFVTIGMTSSVIGFKALKSSFKMISLFSFGNFSIGQGIMIMVLAEIIGILALATLMGYVSFKTKKTTVAIGMGVSLSVFYMIGSRFVLSSASFMRYLLDAIPMASSNVLQSMYGFSISLGNWEPYTIILEISIVFILSTIALVVGINKHKGTV